MESKEVLTTVKMRRTNKRLRNFHVLFTFSSILAACSLLLTVILLAAAPAQGTITICAVLA